MKFYFMPIGIIRLLQRQTYSRMDAYMLRFAKSHIWLRFIFISFDYKYVITDR